MRGTKLSSEIVTWKYIFQTHIHNENGIIVSFAWYTYGVCAVKRWLALPVLKLNIDRPLIKISFYLHDVVEKKNDNDNDNKGKFKH